MDVFLNTNSPGNIDHNAKYVTGVDVAVLVTFSDAADSVCRTNSALTILGKEFGKELLT